MCSIFTFKTNTDTVFVGRNFDWISKGGNIHFVTPYRSYGIHTYAFTMLEQMGEDRPYEGMNEKGLFVGMAAVYNSTVMDSKEMLMNDLGIMRFILERASSTEEALKIIKRFRLHYMQNEGFPKVHYMFADKTGAVALYEEDEYEVLKRLDKGMWDAITNFSLNSSLPCVRLQTIKEALSEGKVTDALSAMQLLACAKSSDTTVWSSIYHLSEGKISLSIEQNYEHSHEFILADEINKGNHSIDFGTLKLRSRLI